MVEIVFLVSDLCLPRQKQITFTVVLIEGLVYDLLIWRCDLFCKAALCGEIPVMSDLPGEVLVGSAKGTVALTAWEKAWNCAVFEQVVCL